jgi:putative ABC transport system permease protein
LRRRLSSVPGVHSVSCGSSLPLAGPHWNSHWGTEEARADPGKLRQMTLVGVQPDYFETLGSRLLAGRTFAEADNAPGLRLAVIDELLAAKAFPNQPAVGKRILARLGSDTSESFQVIGVVGRHRILSLASDPREQMFVPEHALGPGRAVRWAIRAGGDPMRLAGQIRAEVARMGGLVAVSEIQTMRGVIAREQAHTRFLLALIGVFAVIAACLAIVGLYGVLSTSVRRRTAEMGVRMALGATPSKIFTLVVGHGLRLSLAGIILGAAGAAMLTRIMTGVLIGVEPTDKLTFAAMPAFFLLISALACWIPASRAARLDPNVALREQ